MQVKDLHFWEKYWVFAASLFSGVIIGFGLGGQEVRGFYPFITALWLGLLGFHWFFKKKVSTN